MSKSPSLRRIQADIRELSLDPSDQYCAAPLETDMFEWHFTIRGAAGTDFEGGMYHGRILLSSDYPFKPPHIMFLTKSGRFEVNQKICLSFSAFHPELWQPAWGIRLILEALIAFLPTPGDGALGSLNWSPQERQKLAKVSCNYYCTMCRKTCQQLLPPLRPEQGPTSNRFCKEIEALKQLQQQEHATEENEGEEKDGETETKKEQAEDTGTNEGGAAVAVTVDSATKKAPPKPASNESVGDLSEVDSLSRNDDGEGLKDDIISEPTKAAFPETTTTTTPSPEPAEAAQVPEPSLAPEPRQEEEEPVPMQLQDAPQRDAVGVDPNLENQFNVIQSTMLDPVLQLCIIVLSILCFFLIRKIRVLLGDLKALDNQEL